MQLPLSLRLLLSLGFVVVVEACAGSEKWKRQRLRSATGTIPLIKVEISKR
jgi:D-serine dehydratase